VKPVVGVVLLTLAVAWLLSWLTLVVATRQSVVLSVSGAALSVDRSDALSVQARVRDGFRRAWPIAVILAGLGIWLIASGA
jgi:hypothetical protein